MSGLLRISALLARIKSSSAYFTHSRASSTSLIQRLPFGQNFAQEKVSSFLLFRFDFFWRLDENIHRELARIQQVRDGNVSVNIFRLGVHDDQQVHVAIRCGIPIRIRTKQDNFLRSEFRDNPLNCPRQSFLHRRKPDRADLALHRKHRGFHALHFTIPPLPPLRGTLPKSDHNILDAHTYFACRIWGGPGRGQHSLNLHA